MAVGILRIQTLAVRSSAPVPNAVVVVTGTNFRHTVVTDSEGNGGDLSIDAPDCSYSLQESNTTVLPYTPCNIKVTKDGYRPVTIEGAEIFAGQITLARPELIPETEPAEEIPDPPDDIPVHVLYAGDGGSGPSPASSENSSENLDQSPVATEKASPSSAGEKPLRVLSQVIIPKNITVHLGKPALPAENVTVSFRDYIANVASSEVYPTWPEQALRANIHCQVSLALNRIYTEWYPSKGYSYNITNSTSYDQYFVKNRTLFDVMVRLTDDLFNTYVRKSGTVNPYYTEYCDGKSVTCPGLKQWGTVELANKGYDALQILKYYYGNDIEIVRTNNIQSIPESYPGSPIRRGDSGTAVYTLQRQLNRIAKDYPSFGFLTIDGIFGEAMENSVKNFQTYFNLTPDGIVGRQTWLKISYIYVSVKDLAELTSEGETSSGVLSGGTWGGTILRNGAKGSAVQQLQYWLSFLALYYASIPTVTVDGSFGAATETAVKAFQKRFELTEDGIVGETTWNALYSQYSNIQSDNGTPNAYPNKALREGDRGANVRLVQFWLKMAQAVYTALSDLTVDGVWGSGTTTAVKKFQSDFGLTSDGVVGRTTWNKLFEVYTGIAQRPHQFQPSARRISG